MIKKVLSIFLTLIMIVAVVCGCSSKKEGDYEIKDKIPTDALYISIDSVTRSEGQEFPETKAGDVFQSGDYRYGYERVFNKNKNMWIYDPEYIGKWSVYVIDNTKEEYEKIPNKINGIDVKVPDSLYDNCKNYKPEK